MKLMKGTGTVMRNRKRLNLTVLALMLIFFSGTAFAYTTGEVVGQRAIFLSDEAPLRIQDGRMIHSPGLTPRLINVGMGGVTLSVDFDVTFGVPGQFVTYRFDIENGLPYRIPINENNLRLNNLGPGERPEWLLVTLYPTNEFYIEPGLNPEVWGFTVEFNPAVRSNTHYMSETHRFSIEIEQPEPLPPSEEEPSPPPPPPAEEPPENGNGGNNDTETDVSAEVATPDDLVTALAVDADADEYLYLDDSDVPLGYFAPEYTPSEYEYDDEDIILEYVFIDDLGVPLGTMPQTGLRQLLLVFLSGFALTGGIALLFVAQIRKLRMR